MNFSLAIIGIIIISIILVLLAGYKRNSARSDALICKL